VVGVWAGVATRTLASLSVEEVCALLHRLDLGKYDAGFRAFPVNGSVLAAAEEQDLEEVPHRLSLTVLIPPRTSATPDSL
jgi:hypothetical protein